LSVRRILARSQQHQPASERGAVTDRVGIAQ